MKPPAQEVPHQPADTAASLSTGQLVGTAGLALLASILGSAKDTSPWAYALGVLVSSMIVLSVAVLPRRHLVYPLFLLIVNLPDITQTYDDEFLTGRVVTASPWQLSFGPVTGSIIVLLVTGVCLARLHHADWVHRYRKLVVYLLVAVPVVSFAYGYPQENLQRFATDAKVGVMLCLALATFTSYYIRFPEQLLRTSQAFIALAVGHFALDAYRMLSGISITDVSGFKNISIDSGKGLLTLLIFLFIGRIIARRSFLVGASGIVFATYLMMSYQTRWLLVTLLLGLVMTALLHGTKRIFRVIVPLVLVAVIAVPTLRSIAPDAAQSTLLRFSFLGNLDAASTLEDIDVARATTIANAMALVTEKRAWLTGLGYGSWFDDRSYPVPALGLGAFDPNSLEQGRYYRVHDFTFHLLFKFGIIGLILYIGMFAGAVRRILGAKTQFLALSQLSTVATVICGSAPMVATYMYWTGKGLLATGLFIAVTHAWGDQVRANYPTVAA